MIHKKNYYSLLCWIILFEIIAYLMGMISKTGIDEWYVGINRSSLTPPNYIFPIVWPILYAMIATAGWYLWSIPNNSLSLSISKNCFIIQTLLNWAWSPIFFYFHLPNLALMCIVLIILFTLTIIYKSYKSQPKVSMLLGPYVLWSMFAFYLNAYICIYNG